MIPTRKLFYQTLHVGNGLADTSYGAIVFKHPEAGLVLHTNTVQRPFTHAATPARSHHTHTHWFQQSCNNVHVKMERENSRASISNLGPLQEALRIRSGFLASLFVEYSSFLYNYFVEGISVRVW
jgi:hypothetical protein